MEIKELLQENNFRYNRQFGQNFIFDVNLLSAIVRDAKVSKEDCCVEIGAGAGTLTRQIALAAGRVLSYEIDKNLKDVLKKAVPDENVEFVFEDFLKSDIADVERKIGGNYKVVANLPYYITSPLIMLFTEKAQNCDSLTVMVQKEVAERLCANPSTKQYGAITVAVQSVADVYICRHVPASAFTPRPDVDSAVVNIVFNRSKNNIENPEVFRKTVKAAFSMRRKTLENNLLNSFGFDRITAQEIIAKSGLSQSVRGETLSVEQFITLADNIANLTD